MEILHRESSMVWKVKIKFRRKFPILNINDITIN